MTEIEKSIQLFDASHVVIVDRVTYTATTGSFFVRDDDAVLRKHH